MKRHLSQEGCLFFLGDHGVGLLVVNAFAGNNSIVWWENPENTLFFIITPPKKKAINCSFSCVIFQQR